MYFFLLTNYSNYVAFDGVLALLDPLKKRNSKFSLYVYGHIYEISKLQSNKKHTAK